MANLPLDRRSLRLSWSDAVARVELYVGKDVKAFASNRHFHEGWQLVAVIRGERLYEFKSGTALQVTAYEQLVRLSLVDSQG